MPFGSKLPFSFLLLSLVGLATLDTLAEEPIVPLYNDATKLEPATSEETDTALVTRIADRVRDRHAREGEFHAYDHYLSWYWQERTFKIEIVDEVAKGGKRITVNIESLTPLNGPNFRCFYRGKNTVAEYLHNAIAKEVGKNRYSTVIRHNPRERRGLKVGDKMEFEFIRPTLKAAY